MGHDSRTSPQKSCLSVSRLFHDLAMRLIFSMIRLHLRDDSHVDILNRIRKFAMLVKKLAVVSFGPPELRE
jgi:hypothetical protein